MSKLLLFATINDVLTKLNYFLLKINFYAEIFKPELFSLAAEKLLC